MRDLEDEMPNYQGNDYRVLLFSPAERGASPTCETLTETRLDCRLCPDVDDFCRAIGQGAGVVVLTQEALTPEAIDILARILNDQPPWANLPLILLWDPDFAAARQADILYRLGEGRHVMAIERPMGRGTLVTTVQAALESRRRQYQVRDLLARLQRANEELERRVAERTAALRESEQRIQATIENAGMGILEVDEQDHFIAANEAICRMLGYRREELLQMTVHDLTHPDDRLRSDELNAEVHVGRVGQVSYAKRYLRRDGRPLWVNVTVSAVRDDAGRYLRGVGIVEDITERRRAEEALQKAKDELEVRVRERTAALQETVEELRESEQSVRMAHQAARIGAFEWNIETNVNTWSPELETMHGLRPGEFGRTESAWEQLVHPEDREAAIGLVNRALESGEPTEGEWRVRWPDGSVHWIYGRFQALKDEAGRARRLIGVNIDVTERKSAEEAVSRQAALLDLSPDAIIVRTPEGTVTFWSRGAEALYGWTRQEAVGRITHELLLTQFPQPLADIHRELRRTGRWTGELIHRTKSGKTVTVQSRWLAQFDGRGEIMALLESNVDITGRKAAEEALRRSNRDLAQRTAQLQVTVEELKRSNEDLERFAWISSHDLQEPVRMVSMYVGALAGKYSNSADEETREFMAFAGEGARRISTLIKDLLEYSRVNSEGRPLSPTDTATTLRRVLHNLQMAIREAHAQVSVGNLPTVLADATQLGQVFQNLIENALKYRKDTEPPVIRIGAERRDGHWLFSVRDNGIGIDPQFHEQVFIAFKRLHADRGKYPGTGIGLAIVKRIIERHHGRVCLDSKPGEGSTFYFTLPAAESGEQVQRPADGSPSSAACDLDQPVGTGK